MNQAKKRRKRMRAFFSGPLFVSAMISERAFSCEMLFEEFKRNFIFKIIQPLKYFNFHLYLPGMFQP